MSKAKKQRLGRGLGSLISVPIQISSESAEQSVASVERADLAIPEFSDLPHATDQGHQMAWIDVDSVESNPFQPRRQFDEKALNELAQSIRQDGVMQPIVARLAPDRKGYQIVAGERRWRAAKKAGLKTIPAILKDLDEQKMAEWALIENLQRKDLDPMDRAEAFARLSDRFGMTHYEIAERVGVERSTISNMLRLLDLSPTIQDLVRSGLLTSGHARAILSVDDLASREALAKKIVKDSLSVRQAENLSQAGRADHAGKSGDKSFASVPAHLADVQKQIELQLGTRVALKPGKKKGSGVLQIHFFNLDQFDSLIQRLGVRIE